MRALLGKRIKEEGKRKKEKGRAAWRKAGDLRFHGAKAQSLRGNAVPFSFFLFPFFRFVTP